MLKQLNKTLKLCLLIIFAGIILTSCEMPTPTPGGTGGTTGGITEKALKELPFEDLTVEYMFDDHILATYIPCFIFLVLFLKTSFVGI